MEHARIVKPAVLTRVLFTFFSSLVISGLVLTSFGQGGSTKARAQSDPGICPPYDPLLAGKAELVQSLPLVCQEKFRHLLARPAPIRSKNPAVSPQAVSPGPDDFGYTSQNITYSWISAGTDSTLTGEGNALELPIGFNFPFYENSYSSVYLNTSGFVSFGSASYFAFFGQPIPSEALPNDLIAAFWDDLLVGTPYNTGGIYYTQAGVAPNRYLVIEWRSVNQWYASDIFSFEMILYENGNIVFQYQSLPENQYNHTVGIEDSDASDGLQLCYRSGCLTAGQAVRFNYPASSMARVHVTPRLQARFIAAASTTDLPLLIKNIGTSGADTYDLIPPGASAWTVNYYLSNGSTLLTDTNANGYIDTGPMAQGSSKSILARITLPAGASAGYYLNWGLTVRSSVNPAKTKVVTFHLTIPDPFVGVYESELDNAMKLMVAGPGGTNDYAVTPESTYGYAPAVTRSTEGNYLYAWYEYGVSSEVRYALVNANGSLTRSPASIAANPENISDYGPAVAVAPNGMMGIVWTREQRNASSQYFRNIYFAILDASGNPVYGPVSITSFSTYGTWGTVGFTSVYSPTIAATTDNRFVLGWMKQTFLGMPLYQINVWYAIRDTSNGVILAPAAFTTDNISYAVTASALPGGQAILTWYRFQWSTGNLHFGVVNSSGVVLKGDTQLSTVATTDPPIAVGLPNGNVAVGWTNMDPASSQITGIAYAILNSSFNLVAGPTVALSSQPNLTGNAALSLTTDYLSRINFTWTDSYTLSLQYALGDSSGVFIVPPLVYQTSIDGNAFTISWNGQGNAYLPSPPGAFTRTSPADGSLLIPASSSLQWGASANAVSYEYCVDTINNSACDASWINTGTTTSAALSGITNSTSYFWQVRALNYDGTTEANSGTWGSFHTDSFYSWNGGVLIASDRLVTTIGRPQIGSQVMTYNSFPLGATSMYVPMLFKNQWGYNAALYIQNVDLSNSANITINYYDTTGVLSCTKTDTIPKLSSHGYWLPSETCLPASWVGGAVVTSDYNIVAVGRPHIGSEITTYNGFASGATSMYVPMLFKNIWGYDSAFYVQDVDPDHSAAITVKFYDTNGNLTYTMVDTIPPYSSHGYWLPSISSLGTSWVGGVVVTSDYNIVAVGRPHLGAAVTTYDGFAGGSTNIYIPSLFKQMWGSYDSALYIQNLDPSSAADITLKFYDPAGSLTCTQTDSIPLLSSHGYWLPSLTCLGSSWQGSVKVESSTSVVAVGRPHIGGDVATYGGFNSGSNAMFVPMLFRNIWGNYNSALTIQNIDPANPASVTLQFYDTNGTLSCTKNSTIPALGTLGYWLPSLICDP